MTEGCFEFSLTKKDNILHCKYNQTNDNGTIIVSIHGPNNDNTYNVETTNNDKIEKKILTDTKFGSYFKELNIDNKFNPFNTINSVNNTLSHNQKIMKKNCPTIRKL